MSEREPAVLGEPAVAAENGEDPSDAVTNAADDDETARMTFTLPADEAEAEAEAEAEDEAEAEAEDEGEDNGGDDDQDDADADEDDDDAAAGDDDQDDADDDEDKAGEVDSEPDQAGKATAAAPMPAHKPVPARRRREAPVFRVAGFWRRLAAAAIDLAIILPVALGLSWVAGKVAGVHLPPSRHRGLDFWLDLFLASDPALFGAIGLTLAIATVYVLLFQVTMAQTPGMRALKTRIIDVYGDPPATGRAATRTVGYLVGIATLGLGFLWIGFDSEKRGLHDWMSRTYVVKV